MKLILSTMAMVLASSVTWAAEVNTEIDQLAEMHVVGESLLKDFDREQQQAGRKWSLEKSKSYQKLQALRIEREQLTHNIVHQLMDQIADGKAAVALTESLLGLAKKSPEHIIVLEDIANLLIEEQPALARLILDDTTRNQIVSTNRAEWGRRGRKLRAQRDFGSVEIQSEERNFAAKIEPSSGSNGNVTGSEFPARTWALTFDDGPHATRTLQDLNELRAHGVYATFFWLAENVLRLTNIVQSVRSAGMPTQNHSYTHADLRNVSTSGLNHEITDSTNVETQVYGVRPTFFRLPYGAGVSNTTIRKKIASEKMIHVFWNVDSLDWQDKNSSSVFNRVKTGMNSQGRGVILHHDIQPHTPAAIKLLLDWSATLKGTPKQHRWVTLPEIVAELNL